MVVVVHKYALGDHFMVPWVLDYEDRSFLYCYGLPLLLAGLEAFSLLSLFTLRTNVYGARPAPPEKSYHHFN